VPVIDSDGRRGVFDPSAEFTDERGTAQVLIRLEDGRQAVVPVDEMVLQPDGSCTLPFSLAQTAQTGAPVAADAPARRAEDDGKVVIPVVAEQLEVGKRKVEAGGYRISKTVTEREEVVDQPLMREEVHVKRVPVNRMVDGPVPVRHVGDTMIIPLLEEVLVVEKRLMLKEELHVTKDSVETYRPQRVVLRSEQAQVERVGGEHQLPPREDNFAAPAPPPPPAWPDTPATGTATAELGAAETSGLRPSETTVVRPRGMGDPQGRGQ
jgi:uncharacterized protein (TIGR02271 family)